MWDVFDYIRSDQSSFLGYVTNTQLEEDSLENTSALVWWVWTTTSDWQTPALIERDIEDHVEIHYAVGLIMNYKISVKLDFGFDILSDILSL